MIYLEKKSFRTADASESFFAQESLPVLKPSSKHSKRISCEWMASTSFGVMFIFVLLVWFSDLQPIYQTHKKKLEEKEIKLLPKEELGMVLD